MSRKVFSKVLYWVSLDTDLPNNSRPALQACMPMAHWKPSVLTNLFTDSLSSKDVTQRKQQAMS